MPRLKGEQRAATVGWSTGTMLLLLIGLLFLLEWTGVMDIIPNFGISGNEQPINLNMLG